MSNGNADPNVNLGLQLTDAEKAYLAKQMEQSKLAEAEAARNQKRQEWLAKVKESTGNETWEKLNSVKNSAGKTIMDVFKESPQLLDTPESTAVTIDLFKSYSNSHSQNAGAPAGVIDKGADPSRPSNGEQGYVSPTSLEQLFADIKAGKVSKDDIVNSKVKDSDKVLLLQFQLTSTMTSSEQERARNRIV
jgi:hypothetical protein